MASINPYAPRDRMFEELDQLTGRMSALNAFMRTEPFGKLSSTERALMTYQLDVMGKYAKTLQQRIDLFRPLPQGD